MIRDIKEYIGPSVPSFPYDDDWDKALTMMSRDIMGIIEKYEEKAGKDND